MFLLTPKSFSRIDVFGPVRLLPLSVLYTAAGLVKAGFRHLFLGGATLGVVWYSISRVYRHRRRQLVLRDLEMMRELVDGVEEQLEYDREERDLIKDSLNEEQSEELLIELRWLEENIESSELLINKSREAEREWMEVFEREDEGVELDRPVFNLHIHL